MTDYIRDIYTYEMPRTRTFLLAAFNAHLNSVKFYSFGRQKSGADLATSSGT